ncbi:acetyltransferase, partial [Listeria welshimeri]|nr:acetyltransferase [Listeria welshimeri]
MADVIIVGDGGHSKVVRECLEQQGIDTIIGTLDNKYTSYEKNGAQFQAPFDDFERYKKDATLWFIAIGDNKARAEIAAKLGDVAYATIIHPTAIVSKTATIEPGSVIMPLAVIQPDSVI